MMLMPIIDTYYGIPITEHDIQGYTPQRELRGYRIFAIAFAVLTVACTVLRLVSAPSDMGTGLWWVLALLWFSYLLVFLPLAWPKRSVRIMEQGQPLGALNQERLESFWYERNVSDVTDEPIQTPEPTDDDTETSDTPDSEAPPPPE